MTKTLCPKLLLRLKLEVASTEQPVSPPGKMDKPQTTLLPLVEYRALQTLSQAIARNKLRKVTSLTPSSHGTP